MGRNPEREKENLLNGNRFVQNTGEETGVFLRDVDKLFHQYHNLRVSLYNTYKGYMPDAVSQTELMSYIDEQFIRLVKEYSINSEVDFPGYCKIKLTNRVKHSFLKSHFRDRQRVFVTRNDFDVTNLLEKVPGVDEELDYYEALEYALSGLTLSYLEKEVLFLILKELSDVQIEREIRKRYPERAVSSSAIRDTIKDMQDLLRTRLNDSMGY